MLLCWRFRTEALIVAIIGWSTFVTVEIDVKPRIWEPKQLKTMDGVNKKKLG